MFPKDINFCKSGRKYISPCGRLQTPWAITLWKPLHTLIGRPYFKFWIRQHKCECLNIFFEYHYSNSIFEIYTL